MRELISHALMWALRLIFPSRGRHRSVAEPTPVRFVICAPHSAIPVHVLARTMPAPNPVPRIPPYLQGWITGQETEWERQRQRRVSAAAATLGYDVPFASDGSNVARVAVPA
jgi:hypothetical protein